MYEAVHTGMTRILNFQRWKLPPSNFSMTFKHSIWNEDILNTKATINTLKLESWSFQQFEELSSKHFHLETWYFQEQVFPHLKNLQHFEEISSTPFTHLKRLLLSLKPCKLKAFPQKDSPFLCCTSKYFQKLKNKFSTLEKLTTLWRNLFHTSHSLGNTITLFATLQTKSLPSKGFSLSMLYKLNPWLLLILIQCPFFCLVWAHNLLERTWKQTRNETLKVHEMKQLY